MTPRRIDLDQRRTEAGNDDVEVVVSGRTYMFSPRLPTDVALMAGELAGGNDLPWERQRELFMLVTGAMVGPDNAEAFLADIDINELLWLMGEVYGADMGELLASVGSSSSTTNGSRPTSPASTE